MRVAHVMPALLTGGAQIMLVKLLESDSDAAGQLGASKNLAV
jgi:hypothetical protein